MTVKSLRFIAVIALMACLLAGCGGGGGGGVVGPTVTMSVGADTVIGGRTGTRSDITPSVPLEAGSQVVVYDFSNGQAIWNGVAGPDGMCNIGVTPGTTVAVVITGRKSGRDYRLSTIIPVVPIDGGRFICDPVTSIASEAIALKHFGRTAIDQQTFDAVCDKALEFAETHDELNYCVNGGVFGRSWFGRSGSINAAMMQDVLDAVPATINNKVIMARNAVQQIREASLPLASMLQQERPDIENVFAAMTADRYQKLISRLGVILLPAMYGGMEYTNSDGDAVWPTIFDLEEGKSYRVERIEESSGDWSGSYFKLTDLPIVITPGQVTLVYDTGPGMGPSGTYTIVAQRSYNTWTITQTFTGDSRQTYTVTVPTTGFDPGENPTIGLGLRFMDSEFTSPLIFDGTLTAKGADRSSYTEISLDGRITTPEVSASGRLRATFSTDLPSGADPDEDDIYDYPTGFSISDGNIQATDGVASIRITGNVSLSMTPLNGDSGPRMVPKHVESDGTYLNSRTGFRFEGTTTADWANPPDSAPDAQGTARIVGSIASEGRPGYSVDMQFSLDGDKSTTDISLLAGTASLTGSGSGTFDDDGRLDEATMTLVNQNGVEFALTGNGDGGITGTIKVSGNVVADIIRNGDLLRITYKSTPVTFEEYPIRW